MIAGSAGVLSLVWTEKASASDFLLGNSGLAPAYCPNIARNRSYGGAARTIPVSGQRSGNAEFCRGGAADSGGSLAITN